MVTQRLNPLNWDSPIVDAQGRPTPEFVRKWTQQQQINRAPDLDSYYATPGGILVRGTDVWQGLASPADPTKFLNGGPAPAWGFVHDTDLSLADVTGNDVSTAKHGFAPKAPNDVTKFLNGLGAWSVPPGGGGVAWTLAGSWDWSTNVAQVDFTSLGTYAELLVIMRLVTTAVSGQRQILLSTDNGANYRSTSGDYVSISGAGVEGALTGLGFHTTTTTAARSGIIRIENAGHNGTPKVVESINIPFTSLFVQSTSPINAIRFNNTAGGNITAGSLRVLTR